MKAINRTRRKVFAIYSDIKLRINQALKVTTIDIWEKFIRHSITNCKNIKTQLQGKIHKKLEYLRNKQQPKQQNVTQRHATDENRTATVGQVLIPYEKKSLLIKGPSFAPSQKISAVT